MTKRGRAYVPGTWDLFHFGHVRLLARCAGLFEEVFVGVNSDRWVEETKGRAPFLSEEERAEVVGACRLVSAVAIVTDPFGDVVRDEGPYTSILDEIEPEFVVVGSDWLGKIGSLRGAERLGDRGVVFLPYTETISSSEIRRRLGAFFLALPASGAERRPPAGVDGDRGSTWPGGPNPGVSRANLDGRGDIRRRNGAESSCEGLRSAQRASSPSLDSTHSRFSPPPIVDKNDAQSGLLPASGAGRRPRAGVEGDLCSTWPGGPNPGSTEGEA